MRFEFGLRKILSEYVKACRSYAQKADFEQLHIKLSYVICMKAYNLKLLKQLKEILDSKEIIALLMYNMPHLHASLVMQFIMCHLLM